MSLVWIGGEGMTLWGLEVILRVLVHTARALGGY